MNRTIGIVLLIAGLAVAIWGVTMLGDSDASVSIGGLSVEAEDEGQKMQSWVLIGLGLVGLIGGIVLLGRKQTTD